MLDIPMLTAVASIGFLLFVSLVMIYFARLGYEEGHRDTDAGNRSSLAN